MAIRLVAPKAMAIRLVEAEEMAIRLVEAEAMAAIHRVAVGAMAIRMAENTPARKKRPTRTCFMENHLKGRTQPSVIF